MSLPVQRLCHYFTIVCRFQVTYEPLNLGKLQHLVDSGRIDASQPVNMYTLHQVGAVGRVEHGIKLLADVSWITEYTAGYCAVIIIAMITCEGPTILLHVHTFQLSKRSILKAFVVLSSSAQPSALFFKLLLLSRELNGLVPNCT